MDRDKCHRKLKNTEIRYVWHHTTYHGYLAIMNSKISAGGATGNRNYIMCYKYANEKDRCKRSGAREDPEYAVELNRSDRDIAGRRSVV